VRQPGTQNPPFAEDPEGDLPDLLPGGIAELEKLRMGGLVMLDETRIIGGTNLKIQVPHLFRQHLDREVTDQVVALEGGKQGNGDPGFAGVRDEERQLISGQRLQAKAELPLEAPVGGRFRLTEDISLNGALLGTVPVPRFQENRRQGEGMRSPQPEGGESEIVTVGGKGQSGAGCGVRASQWVEVSESPGLFNTPMPMWYDSAIMLPRPYRR